MSHEDKLMKKLWTQERVERWDLYKQFRQATDDYQERMGGEPNSDYYHETSDDSGLGSIVVIDHNDYGHDSYVYLSRFTKNEDHRGAIIRNTRSFSIGKVHYAIRWRFLTERIYNEGDPDKEFKSHTMDAGPTSYIGKRILFGGRQTEGEWQKYLNLYRSFSPETNWHPEPGEQIEVRKILNEAIGEIMMLGYDADSFPLTQEVRNRHGI
jgi:hypothetical protein